MTHEGGLHKSADEIHLVHTLIRAHVPKVVVWFALRLYPSHLRMKDDHGRSPLHWAAESNNVNTEAKFDVKFSGCLGALVEQKRMVELVLDALPVGAKFPDGKGSLPLAILLDVEYRSWTFRSWTRRCVLALIRKAPEALMKKNALNWMLPFMAGAAIHDRNTVKAKTKVEEQQMLNRKLDLTYLIKENPAVLATARRVTLKEAYLQRKLAEAKKRIKTLEELLDERPAKQQKL